jgi:selenocysteine lyase/cysteine desulfurase
VSTDTFEPVPGYLNAATAGLPTRQTRAAMRQALDLWAGGVAAAADYDGAVTAARSLFAQLVSVDPSRVAIGAQTSVTAGTVAASLPDGASVVCVEGDFTSMVFPFLAQADRGIIVRHVPRDGVADALREGDALVAYSIAQSDNGQLVDVQAVREAARQTGAMTFCDTTQAIGWLPTDATEDDITVCSAYKWLCCPRGVAFSTYGDRALEQLRPVNAGWYAGESVWDSCYGPQMQLAADARRFDVSPAWLAWVGAVPALRHIAGLSPHGLAHGSRLADRLREALDLPPQGRPVLALPDDDGRLAAALAEVGCVVAARAGRVRIAFHLWNTDEDVERAAGALTRAGAPTLA